MSTLYLYAWGKMRLLILVLLYPCISFAYTETLKDFEQIMQNYWSAEKFEDRLPYVLEPKKCLPIMDKYYLQSGVRPAKINRIVWMNDNGRERIKTGEYANLRVTAVQDNGKRHTAIYYIKNTGREYKIDWKASIGYNKISWASFGAQKPDFPVNFRVTASLNPDPEAGLFDLNLERGIDHKKFMAISLKGLWDTGAFWVRHGYILKNSDAEKKIFDALKDGEEHQIIVEAVFLSASDFAISVMITDLISNDWLEH